MLMKYIISSGIYLAFLFCLSEFVLNPTNLYYEIPWLDIPMHILGGFGVAALTLSIGKYRKKSVSVVSMILAYLCVAVGWELYEFVHDIIDSRVWNGWQDTLADIFNGAFGAWIAYYFLKK